MTVPDLICMTLSHDLRVALVGTARLPRPDDEKDASPKKVSTTWSRVPFPSDARWTLDQKRSSTLCPICHALKDARRQRVRVFSARITARCFSAATM